MPTSAQNNDFVLVNVIGTCYWCHLSGVNEDFKTLLNQILEDSCLISAIMKESRNSSEFQCIQYYYFYSYIRIMNFDTNSIVFLVRNGIPILLNIFHLIHLVSEEYTFYTFYFCNLFFRISLNPIGFRYFSLY